MLKKAKSPVVRSKKAAKSARATSVKSTAKSKRKPAKAKPPASRGGKKVKPSKKRGIPSLSTGRGGGGSVMLTGIKFTDNSAPPRPPRYVQVGACPNFPTENPWEDGYQFPVVLLSDGGTSTINAPNVQCAIASIFAAPQGTPSLENPIRWLVGSDNTEYTGDASQAIVEVVLSGSASGYTCVVQFIDA